MPWTPQQQEAIDARGKNILVSAAAGSGKTAVLVERITQLLLEEGVSIDEMLIMTFTNAAAREMREKIRKALKQKAPENPELRRQLDLLPRAQISTIHSFGLNVIRSHFYLTDLEPNFRIQDEGAGMVLAQEAMDAFLDSEYEAGQPDFLQFLDWYSSEKSDQAVRDILTGTYRQIRALPEPFEALEEAVREIEACAAQAEACGDDDQALEAWYGGTRAGKQFRALLTTVAAGIAGHVERITAILEAAECEKLAEKLRDAAWQLVQLREAAAAQDYETARKIIGNFSWPQMRAVKAEKDAYEGVKLEVSILLKDAKADLATLSEVYLGRPLADAVREIGQTAGMARTLLRLLRGYDEVLRARKREEGVIDFDDIEHTCFEILKDPEAAREYRDKFRYIFIDEYQDTNLIEEAITERISRGDNVFMVGDIKQSIYKFRLAEPEIFRDKYDRFRKEQDAPDAKSQKIDLNRNFRSKKPILDSVNALFEPIMENYDDDAKLYEGMPYVGQYTYPVQLWLASQSDLQEGSDDAAEEADGSGGEAGEAGSFGAEDAGREADDALEDLKKNEVEARLACRLIQDQIGRKIYDAKKGEVREVRYSDIVILLRSVVSNVQVYRDQMKAWGIPLVFEDSTGYFDRLEITVFTNLLSVIDNRYQDVPLLSCLRSEVFGFTTGELAEIRRRHRTGSYASAFLAEAEAGQTKETEPGEPGAENAGADPLQARCARALASLSHWKALALAMPLADFIWTLLQESGYYMMAGAMPGGGERQANLRVLADRAAGFAGTGQGTLYGFLRYLDAMKKRKAAAAKEAVAAGPVDAVRLMTIHKSKGLEFPVVLVCGMGSQLRYTNRSSKVLFHKDVGLSLSLEDPAAHTSRRTLTETLIAQRSHDEEYQENIRVLYVAMTRAKENLILTGVVKDAEKFLANKEAGKWSSGTYLDMLRTLPQIMRVPRSFLVNGEAEKAGRKQKDWFRGEPDEAVRELVRARLLWEYPHRSAGGIRSKYSVSALSRRMEEEEQGGPLSPKGGSQLGADDVPQASGKAAETPVSFRMPLFLQDERRLTAAERGTVYHGIFERLDFVRASREGLPYLQETAEALVQDGVFFENEVAAVDLSRIDAFFRTDLGRRATAAYAAGRLWKEQSFNLLIPADGENMIVQGIVDCYFDEEGALVLFDYKSNRIDPRRPPEEERRRLADTYRGQLQLYKQALEEGTGKPVKESWLYLIDVSDVVPVE